MCNSLRLAIALLMVVLTGCDDSNLEQASNKSNDANPVSDSPAPVRARYAIGNRATKQLIAGWDIDIAADGTGLPEGSGSVADGEPLYDNLCAACHGTFGEGEEQWPKLTGGENSLTDQRPLKTVGSYWPYSTTLWDYINRAMPFPAPQSLEVDQVYAITAYVLYMNEIIEDDFILTNQNLAAIKMPNAHGFYLDDRPDTSNQRCMKNCKSKENIKIKSAPAFATTNPNTPIEKVQTEGITNKGQAIYLAGCNLCHDNGLMQAPKIGTKLDWNQRLQQGKESVYQNAINGIGSMPAKGGRNDLTNNSIKQAVDYMLETLE